VFGLLVTAISSAATVAEGQTPKLELVAFKLEILTGEPLVVGVTIESQDQVRLDPSLRWGASNLRILIDRGSGFAPYLERTVSSGWREDQSGPLPQGRAFFEFVLGDDELRGGPAFDRAGTSRVAAEYRSDTGEVMARSNEVAVQVVAPSASEASVLQSVRALSPDAFSIHEAEPLGQLSTLVGAHGASVYLQEAQLNDLRFRVARIESGYDSSREGIRADEDPPNPDLRIETLRQRYASLIPVASGLEQKAGQFAPEVALILARLYEGAGETNSAQGVYERILRVYPGRRAARVAAERVGDAEAPQLSVTASPASLWPPNHKLIPVTVNAEVSDDQDPNPAVKLLSITCDDACDPALDIVGAAYGTDDRQFDLRSERKGTSKNGRTYTITYSATDASGNSTTSTTTVMVPHDQGKKK
jgi:hypothetical protein